MLREPGFRERMMAEVAPDHWVGPTLAPMKSFLEPLQGGTLKKLAAIKRDIAAAAGLPPA